MPETKDDQVVVTERPGGNGWRASARAITVSPRRRRMISWVALGTLGIVLCALTFGAWAASQDSRVPVTALAVGLAAGERLSEEHLSETLVAADTGALVRIDDVDRFLGRVALLDLPEGTLLTEALFAPSLRMGSGEAVVGVTLDAAELPIPTLAPGHGLLLVRTPPPETGGLGDGDADVAAWWGEVFDVAAPSDSSGAVDPRVAVSLRVAEAFAPQIAAAAASGRLRLVLVPTPGPLGELPALGGALADLLTELEEGETGAPDPAPPPEEAAP